MDRSLPVAEFFAGVGLVRTALEQAERGFEVVWANDIEPSKAELYRRNFSATPDAADHLVVDDVRAVKGRELPDITLATASFPCTDLSLAGSRGGIRKGESSMFWEFARVLDELRDEDRLPSAICLENVPGFAYSNGGRDMRDAVAELNRLGYSCDVLALDAARWVPQSRARVFVVGTRGRPDTAVDWATDEARPDWLARVIDGHDLALHRYPLPDLPDHGGTLADVVQKLPPGDDRWWEPERQEAFVSSLSDVQAARLEAMRSADRLSWRTAYRRTRQGVARWEIRADGIAGCLRTVRGGSSRQAVVQAGRGTVRVRWMTPLEYARLQGAGDYRVRGFRSNEVWFGFGDAVCVPVVSWLATHYLAPVLEAA